MRTASRAPGPSASTSTRESTPSRASTNPACARRKRWAAAEITESSKSPAGMNGDDAAGERVPRDAAEAGGARQIGESIRSRKAADRFREISVGGGVAGDQPTDLGNDLKRIELVEPVQTRHVD